MAVPACDVLVVGGGPAGSTCAARLIRACLDVVVMDKSRFPRDKTCAGWITPQVVETLGLDLADYAAGRVLQPITGFVTGLVGREPRHTHFDRVVSYGIRRCEFDHYLLERSGPRLRLGEAVTQIEVQTGARPPPRPAPPRKGCTRQPALGRFAGGPSRRREAKRPAGLQAGWPSGVCARRCD